MHHLRHVDLTVFAISLVLLGGWWHDHTKLTEELVTQRKSALELTRRIAELKLKPAAAPRMLPTLPPPGKLFGEAEAVAIAQGLLVAHRMRWGEPVQVHLRAETYWIVYETSYHERALLGPRTIEVNRVTGKATFQMRC